MNEEIRPIYEDRVDPELEKRELKRTYNRCGWILFVLSMFGFVLSRLMDRIPLDKNGAFGQFFDKNILLFNSLFVGIEILPAALLLLIFLPKSVPARQKVSGKEYLKLVFVSFGVSWVGGMISQFFINFVYFISGIEIKDRVSEAIGTAPIWQIILCAVIIAPITEEFLFRKLLIDRLYKHGELVAILTSAVFFGLFHKNVFQLVYTTGAGLILGYLYCKTGRYIAATALHMIFNLIGVIPVFFTSKINEFAGMTQEELSALPPEIYAQFSGAMSGYITYSAVMLVVNVVGIIILILNIKKIRIENNAPALLESDKREIIVRTPGIVVSGVALILMTIGSLFI